MQPFISSLSASSLSPSTGLTRPGNSLIMAGLFPRTKEKCDPSVASACCAERRLAVRSGRYYWSLELGGWVDRDNPVRSMRNWEIVVRAGQNTSGIPYIIEICGFCGCALPELFKPPKIVDRG